jgi:hypothetical protein
MTLPRAIVELDDYQESTNHIIYGDTGAGKTPLLGTAPKMLILALTREQGLISARRTGSTAKVWPIKQWEDAVEAYKYLESGDHPFENVGVDGLSTLQDVLLSDIVAASHRANPAKRHAIIPAQDNYLESQLKLKQWIGHMNELPINCWYSALAMRKDDEEGEQIVLPLLKGKDYMIAQEICAMMHTVGWLDVPDDTKDDRRLHYARRGPYFAKDRLMCLGRYIDNPTIPAILQRIQKGSSTARPTTPSAGRKRRPATGRK